MLVCPDLHAMDRISKQLVLSLGVGVLAPEFSWLSMTERSEYTTSEEEFAASLIAEEKLVADTPEFEERMKSFRERMTKYLKDPPRAESRRLAGFLFLPDVETPRGRAELVCARLRSAQKTHGRPRPGRSDLRRPRAPAHHGIDRLDDGEWGVTLFAHTTSDIKAIVYEMRFDEVSAQYADFGEFFIGIQMPLDALFARLGL